MSNEIIFAVGGTVQASNGLYISRRVDDELLAVCRAGKFAYVLTPRQLGKSSLMVRTAEQLAAEGTRSVIIDLSLIGVQVTAEAWYLGLLSVIEEQLNLQTDAVSWWRQRAHLGVTQRLTKFFEEVLLKEVDAPVVVFVDEIDTTLSLDFTDDFFAAIRYFFNARARSTEVRRLSLVLIGVATPGDLIRDPDRTPFNIGQRVDLSDFTFEDALPLASGLGLSDAQARQVLEWVMKWTNGHPYLTLRLCKAVTDAPRTEWSEQEIDELVARTFFGRISEEDNNLQFVRDMLTKRAPDLSEVLYTYRAMLRQTKPIHDEAQSLVKSHLKLSGVAQRQHRELIVRNPIYAEVFNDSWVKEHLPVDWYRRARRAGVPLAFALVLSAAIFFGFSTFAANRRLGTANQFVETERVRAEMLTAQAAERSRTAELAKRDAEANLKKADEAVKKADEAKRETQQALETAKKSRLMAAVSTVESNSARREAEEHQRLANANLLASTAKLLYSDASLLPVSALLSLEALRLSPTSDVDVLHHVAELLPSEIMTLQQKAAVEVVAFSPDGKYLASGSRDSTAQLWQVGGNTFTRLDHSDQVRALAFSPDSKLLATGEFGGLVRLWDSATGKSVAAFTGTAGHVPVAGVAVAFSPDGKYLASIDGARVVIRDWRANTIVNELIPDPPDQPIEGMVMSPDGTYVLTVQGSRLSDARKGQINLWDWRTAKRITSRAYVSSIYAAAFTPDSSRFAVASRDGSVEILDIPSIKGHWLLQSQAVVDIAFSHDGKYLATASSDKTATVWDASSGRPLIHLQQPAAVNTLAFNFSGEYLVTAGMDGAARVWQWQLQRLVAVMPQQFGVYAIAFSPDGQMLASAGEDSATHVWKFTPAQLTRGEALQNSRLAFSHDGKLTAQTGNNLLEIWKNPTAGQPARSEIITRDNSALPVSSRGWEIAFMPANERIALARPLQSGLMIVNAQNPNMRKVIDLATAPLLVALSRNGKYLAFQLNTGANNMHIWDLATDTEIASFEPPSLYRISFSPNGEYLAVGTYESTVQLWKVGGVRQAEKQTEFYVNTIPIDLACSPDGKYVAVNRKDDPYAIAIWETARKKEIAFIKHNDSINAFAFSPDGKFLATASDDGTARIWDVTTGVELGRLTYDNPVIDIAFSDDDRYIATATSDGIVHTWFRRPEELAEMICNRLTRNLTQDEWTHYVGKMPYRKTCLNLP